MKASDRISLIAEKYRQELDYYTKSKKFNDVASKATVDFVKRVKRTFMPSLGPIKPLSKSYIEFRKGNMMFLTNKKTGKPFVIKNTTQSLISIGKTKKKSKKAGSHTPISFGSLNMQDQFKPVKLAEDTRPSMSNATLSGQMLKAIRYFMRPNGFIIYVPPTARTKVTPHETKTLNNAQVAKFYALKRPIFDLSNPEYKRIIRNIRIDLIDLINLTRK